MKTIRVKFEHVHLSSQESKLLGMVMAESTEMSHTQAQRVSAAGHTFDANQFMRRVAAFMGGDVMDWDKVGRVAARRLRRTPTVDFLLGPLAVQVKQRTRSAPLRLNKAGKVTHLKRLDEKEREEIKDETTINVQKVPSEEGACLNQC